MLIPCIRYAEQSCAFYKFSVNNIVKSFLIYLSDMLHRMHHPPVQQLHPSGLTDAQKEAFLLHGEYTGIPNALP